VHPSHNGLLGSFKRSENLVTSAFGSLSTIEHSPTSP